MMSGLEQLLVALNASVVLSVVVKITVTTGVALAAAHFSRRSCAAVRHAQLLAAFGVLLALPVAATVAPAFIIGVPVVTPASRATPGETLTDEPATPANSDVVTPLEPQAPARSVALTPATFLVVAWGLGAILSLLPILIGLRHVLALRRSGLPWTQGRDLLSSAGSGKRRGHPIDVVVHEAVAGPMTCGLSRPTILLPRDAATWTADDLRRALVHELEHVRRWDWASQ